jgi:hypothetical protein
MADLCGKVEATVRPKTQAEIDSIETAALLTSRACVTIDDIGPTIDVNLRPVGMEWSVDPAGAVVTIVLGAP